MTLVAIADALAERVTPLVRIRGLAQASQGILERMREHAVPGLQVAVIEAGTIDSWDLVRQTVALNRLDR